ncbi:MAG: DUF11 domain-containing protein [Saprospiraceae bacterium]|nr:DUF11 domain-containing protein [Saprospiraceae bacterium]
MGTQIFNFFVLKSFVLVSIFVFSGISLTGQITGTVATTESRCISDGSVCISNADPTSLYILTGNNIPQIGPFSPVNGMVVFTDIPSGPYTITELRDDNSEGTQSVTVPGNYFQNWIFSAEAQFQSCVNGTPVVSIGNFQILNASPGQQRSPYTYRISTKGGSLPSDGQGTPPFQNVSSFPITYPGGLNGYYEMQAKDSCGNYKTINVYVPATAPSPALGLNFSNFTSCSGNAVYTATATGGTPAYIYSIIAPSTDQVGTTITSSNPVNFNLTANGFYTIQAMDQCGGIVTQTVNVRPYNRPNAQAWGGTGNCNPMPNGVGEIGLYVSGDGIGPYSATITNNCGAPVINLSNVTPNTATYINNLTRPCIYTVTVEDGCMFTSTFDVELLPPAPEVLGHYNYTNCPNFNGTQFIQTIGIGYGPPYSPQPPFTFEIFDASNNLWPGYPVTQGSSEIYQALPAGNYTYRLTDACGATTVLQPFSIQTYLNPTVTVNTSNPCFGAGQAVVEGINNNPLSPLTYQYQIQSGPTRVGEGPETDSDPNTGKFSSLVSGGTYTFSFYDGCKTVTTSVTIPEYDQPTFEVGYGAICPGNSNSFLEVINLQPEGEIVEPYVWRIIAEDSDLFTDPLPFPNSNGQTSPVFANLPPKNLAQEVATYQILGNDACKNSYLGSGKIGVLPDQTLILNSTNICPSGNAIIRARTSTPLAGGTYVYYKDGVEVARSTMLFTNITNAMPGVYTVRVYPDINGQPNCFTESPGVTVNETLQIVCSGTDPTCAQLNGGSVSVTATNGAEPFTYLWSNGNTNATVNGLLGGTYTVCVIDANMCALDCSYNLIVPQCDSLDVALTKVLTSPLTPVQVGDDVTFTITVFNQGTDPIDSVQIVDYVPAGYIFNSVDNPNWTGSAPSVYYTATIGNGFLPAGGIAPASSVTFTIVLEVAPTATANNIDNFAEISGVSDTAGNVNDDDIDSTPDSANSNDAGGQINSPADNYVDGDGMGIPGDEVAATDEDDHDGARVRFVDLTLVKDISPSSPPPYAYGSPVTYVITVSNQSNEPVQNIEVEDDLPAGFSFIPNNGWTETTPGILARTIAGPLAPGGSISVNLVLTPIPSNQPDAWLNNAQITGFEDENGDPIGDRDFDSDPGNGPSGGLEDDDDNEVIEIFDLALRKRLLTTAPYAYGQLLTFEIEVFNQGNVPATNIVVNDYVPNGYSYVSNNSWTGTFPNLQNTIAGPIAPGGSATLQLELTLQPSTTASFTNYAEIAGGNGPSGPGFDADSNPDSDTSEERDVEPGDPDDDNINGGGPNANEDEDDHDPAGPSIFDLALRKTVDTSAPSYSYGQNVMYTIRIFNQGTIAARDIEIRDTIPCGFEFDAMDIINAGWTQSGQVITRTITSVLNPGQSTAVMVNYIVRPCYTDPSTAWTNYAEIGEAINDETGLPGEDIDSTPDDNMSNDSGGVPDFNGNISGTDNTIDNENGDEDDHDPHQIQVFDLALQKVLTTAGPYNYGQLLTFTVEVFNQGNVTAENIVISDYLPDGYSFVNNNGWTSAGPGLLQNTIAGPLVPGASVPLTLELTLTTGTTGVSWDNYAEVSSSEDDEGVDRSDDADSVLDTNENNDNPVLPGDPDDNNIFGLGPNANEDEDDHDPAAPVIIDIALNKTVTTAGPYSYGQTVSYDIVLTNEGNIPLTNIVVKDELPCGMTYNGGSQPWTVVGNEATTTYTGTLQPFASTTIGIIVTLNPCYTNPGTAWTNIAQVVSMEDEDGDDVSDDDIDSDPNNDDPTEDDQDDETLNVFDLALRKQLTTAPPYNYGQLHTFTVQVFNQGNVAATNIIVNDYVPAGYAFAANNGWTSAGPGLIQNTIAGPIAPGGSLTLTLQMTLLQSDGGERDWINYAEIASGNGPNGPGL